MSDAGGGRRDIELRIRAVDNTKADLQGLVRTINDVSSALNKEMEAAAAGKRSNDELRASITQLEAAHKGLIGVAAQVDQFRNLTTQINASQAAVEKATASQHAYQAELQATEAVTKQQEQSLARLNRERERAERTLTQQKGMLQSVATDLQRAGVDTQNLAQAERDLVAAGAQLQSSLGPLREAHANNARVLREQREATARLREEERQRAEVLRQQAVIEREAAQQRAEALQKEAAAERQVEEAVARLAKARADAARQNTEAIRLQATAALQDFNKRQDESKRRVDDLRRFNEETRGLAAARRAGETSDARARADNLRKEMQELERVEARGRLEADIRQNAAGRGRATGGPGARGAQQTPTILGLRPYELTNLGYQINDVISGLASGQNATQVLAQQGGQFIQIFGMAALRYFPLVAVAAATAAVAIGALHTNVRNLASNREFEAALTANKYAADQSAESLTALRKTLLDLGVSWEDAGKAINTALAGNVARDRMREVALAAEAMAKVTGKTVPEAMADLVEGMSGGIAAFDQLLAKYPAIGDENAKLIRGMFLAGKEGQAQAEILRVLGEVYERARREKLSPFEAATEKLGASWHRLLETLAESAVFQKLLDTVTKVVDGLISLVDWLDRVAKKFDDPKIQLAVKALGILVNPAGAAGAALGGGLGGIFGPGAGPTITPTEAAGARFTTGGLKIDTDELKKIFSAVSEASTSLPPGYRVEAISSERTPGSRTASGGLSEHGFGRALDVRIVDPSGNPVPALMTGKGNVYDPVFQEFDKHLVAIWNRMNPGVPLAVGGTFSAPDAGHYSTGGQEAAITTGRVVAGTAAAPAAPGGPVFGPPTAAQAAAGDAAVRNSQRALDLARAASQTAEENIKREEIRQRLQEQGIKGKAQEQAIENELQLFRQQKNTENYEREQRRNKEAIQDGRERQAIEAGGAKAVADAQANGITNYEKLKDIRDRGEAEARADIQKRKSETDALDAAERRIGALSRQQLNERKAALDQLNAATNLKYDEEIKQIEKLSERASKVDQERYARQKEVIEGLRATELARNVPRAAEQQASEALKTRTDLIQTYTKLEAAGEITITEQQEKTKQAFDLTRESILGAANAIEQYLTTAEGLKETPERVALLTARIKELRAETKYVDPFWKNLKETFETSFASNAERAFDTIGEAIGGLIAKTKTMADVWKAAGTAAANFFAGLLKDIASSILKQELKKLASSILGLGGGEGGGGILGLLGLGGGGAVSGGGEAFAGLSTADEFALAALHSGGVVGRVAANRQAPGWWFANAPRYHNGTMVGLAPNEQAAILQRGEEVLSVNSPRNIMNGGGGRQDINIRSILVDDPERVPAAMASSIGERVVIQHLVRNAATVRQIVKG